MSAGRAALKPDDAVLAAPGRAALACSAAGPVARPDLGRATAVGPAFAQAAAAEPEVVR